MHHRLRWLALVLCVTAAPDAFAGGFEIPENTTLGIARGGTGAVNRSDPSAIYFNPALLPRADGLQVLLDVNMVNLNVDFQRNPLETPAREFSPASNDAGFFPAPFLAVSYDFGIDDLGVGLGIFGPSAYGQRCLTDSSSGDCSYIVDSSARHMMLESDLLQIYFTLGAGYDFHVLGGTLSIGAAASLAYQRTSFTVVVDEISGADGNWNEDPQAQGPLEATELTDIKPTGFFGLAYDWKGLRLGASYRPPISWETEGEFDIDFPESIEGLVTLENQEMTFKVDQAGSLRAGVGYEHGTHPGFEKRPLFDVEFNFVWEDWSRTKAFEIIPTADFELVGTPQPLFPVYQPKNWEDTYSFRLGGSFGALTWLTLHAGGSYETAAQTLENTNVDFVSWERITAGLGLAFHPLDWLDVEIAYSHTFSGDREVEDGAVYQPIPLSACTGPDFTDAGCQVPGTPPGNPQNEGSWSSSFQIISAGVTGRWEL